MTKKKYSFHTDEQTYTAITCYAKEHGITVNDFIKRLWLAWQGIERIHTTLHTTHVQDTLNVSLDTFLEGMQLEADNLDESYE